jgi:hypothetical protein
MGEKKMGRPTANPRTKSMNLRLSENEMKDIELCAKKLGTQRVNAVVEGIRLLKEQLNIVE